MQPSDVRQSTGIVSAHPFVAPRYGTAIADLHKAWLRLVSRDGFCSAVVFEEVDGPRVNMIAVGVTVFVSDDFLRTMKTAPLSWIGPELAKRVARGDSPLLSWKQVQEANSRGGLNLVVWHATVCSEAMQRVEVWNELMIAFMERHRGYFLKEMVANAESVEHLMGMRNTGGFLLDPKAQRYGGFPDSTIPDLIHTPHIIGFAREMAPGSWGSWVGSLFHHQPPQIAFNRSEQRLLQAALDGGTTDEELSDKLGISISAIKKTWQMIYERAAVCLPELRPENLHGDDGKSERGREKKQHLIAYLREHPEELRPISRKLLRRAGAAGIRSRSDSAEA